MSPVCGSEGILRCVIFGLMGPKGSSRPSGSNLNELEAAEFEASTQQPKATMITLGLAPKPVKILGVLGLSAAQPLGNLAGLVAWQRGNGGQAAVVTSG